MGFMKALFGLLIPKLKAEGKIIDTPANPDIAETRRIPNVFNTQQIFTSPLGDTSEKPVRKTRLGE